MTIQEAINSGRRFTRPNYPFWLIVRNNQIMEDCYDGRVVNLRAEDILAIDWEVK
jgi:hypothetical protein